VGKVIKVETLDLPDGIAGGQVSSNFAGTKIGEPFAS